MKEGAVRVEDEEEEADSPWQPLRAKAQRKSRSVLASGKISTCFHPSGFSFISRRSLDAKSWWSTSGRTACRLHECVSVCSGSPAIRSLLTQLFPNRPCFMPVCWKPAALLQAGEESRKTTKSLWSRTSDGFPSSPLHLRQNRTECLMWRSQQHLWRKPFVWAWACGSVSVRMYWFPERLLLLTEHFCVFYSWHQRLREEPLHHLYSQNPNSLWGLFVCGRNLEQCKRK